MVNYNVVVNARFLTQPITGVQRFAIELALRLKAHYGDALSFVCPDAILHPELANLLGAKVIGKCKGHLWEQVKLPLFLKKQGSPLLLNLCNTAPVFYKNKIATIHDLAFIVYPKAYSARFYHVYKQLIPAITSTSKRLITVSQFSKSEIIRHYEVDADKIDVVYNAVSAAFHPHLDPQLQEERYFLAVSSLNYRKNFKLVVDAFLSVAAIQENIKLYIIGDMRNESFAHFSLPTDQPNISVLGRVSDDELVRYYSNALAFLYPSFYEGFGLPPLEAQACECPVIVSNASCLPEIFGESTLYCDPNSIDSLAEKMRDIQSEHLRQDYILRGKANCRRFSWDESAKQLVAIIDMTVQDKT